MKKNKKLIILIIAIIVIIIVAIIMLLNKKKPEEIQIETTPTPKFTVEGPALDLANETEPIKLQIYSLEGNKEVETKYNANSSKEEQTKRIVEKVGTAIGYKIEVNSVQVEENKIRIDLNKNGAPFNDSAYMNSEVSDVYIGDYKSLVYTVFNSIALTLKQSFGEETQVYFTVDKSRVYINNITPIFSIGISEAYEVKNIE